MATDISSDEIARPDRGENWWYETNAPRSRGPSLDETVVADDDQRWFYDADGSRSRGPSLDATVVGDGDQRWFYDADGSRSRGLGDRDQPWLYEDAGEDPDGDGLKFKLEFSDTRAKLSPEQRAKVGRQVLEEHYEDTFGQKAGNRTNAEIRRELKPFFKPKRSLNPVAMYKRYFRGEWQRKPISRTILRVDENGKKNPYLVPLRKFGQFSKASQERVLEGSIRYLGRLNLSHRKGKNYAYSLASALGKAGKAGHLSESHLEALDELRRKNPHLGVAFKNVGFKLPEKHALPAAENEVDEGDKTTALAGTIANLHKIDPQSGRKLVEDAAEHLDRAYKTRDANGWKLLNAFVRQGNSTDLDSSLKAYIGTQLADYSSENSNLRGAIRTRDFKLPYEIQRKYVGVGRESAVTPVRSPDAPARGPVQSREHQQASMDVTRGRPAREEMTRMPPAGPEMTRRVPAPDVIARGQQARRDMLAARGREARVGGLSI